MRVRAAQLLYLAALVSHAPQQPARMAAHRAPAPEGGPSLVTTEGRRTNAVGADMQHVDFHIESDVILSIRRLRGSLTPTRTGEPPRLDDNGSFILNITSAVISIDTTSLSALLNRHVFGYPGSPLRQLHVGVEGDQLVQTGVLHKLVDLPFRIHATISLTPEGDIRLHPTNVKVLGINAAGLMKLFRVRLGGLIKLQAGHGARIDQDDFILNAAGMLPPPAMRGRLTAIRIADGRLEQTFGPSSGAETTPVHRPGSSAPNFMYFHGGMLRFGKLTMSGTDLEIVDNDPRDPFDYDPNRYNDHLVAGWSQSTISGGLVVHMPDLKRLPARAPPASARATER